MNEEYDTKNKEGRKMNDIKRGIFEIDGIEINRDTKVENVSTNKMNVWVSDKFEGNARVNSLSNKLSFLGEQLEIRTYV